MSGFYVRVYRENKWQSLDVVDLTHDELKLFARSQPKERLVNWFCALVGHIYGLEVGAKRVLDGVQSDAEQITQHGSLSERKE